MRNFFYESSGDEDRAIAALLHEDVAVIREVGNTGEYIQKLFKNEIAHVVPACSTYLASQNFPRRCVNWGI